MQKKQGMKTPQIHQFQNKILKKPKIFHKKITSVISTRKLLTVFYDFILILFHSSCVRAIPLLPTIPRSRFDGALHTTLPQPSYSNSKSALSRTQEYANIRLYALIKVLRASPWFLFQKRYNSYRGIPPRYGYEALWW